MVLENVGNHFNFEIITNIASCQNTFQYSGWWLFEVLKALKAFYLFSLDYKNYVEKCSFTGDKILKSTELM